MVVCESSLAMVKDCVSVVHYVAGVSCFVDASLVCQTMNALLILTSES